MLTVDGASVAVGQRVAVLIAAVSHCAELRSRLDADTAVVDVRETVPL